MKVVSDLFLQSNFLNFDYVGFYLVICEAEVIFVVSFVLKSFRNKVFEFRLCCF